MACSDGFGRRTLSHPDIAGALALSVEAGWNQTAADWDLMLRHGCGFGVVSAHGRLVASALAHTLGSGFGWISMVLVARDFRRRGLASELLKRCIEWLRDQGVTPGLDATEAGRQVYERLGFLPVYGLTRLTATVDRMPPPPSAKVRPAHAADLARLLVYDRAIFGGERGHILAHLLGRAPHLAFVAEHGGGLRGFVMGRDGANATQIGPLVAEDPATAAELVAHALAATAGPVYIDAVDDQPAFCAQLRDRGFAPQRGFTRMLLGRSLPFDDPRRVFAIAGPEFG